MIEVKRAGWDAWGRVAALAATLSTLVVKVVGERHTTPAWSPKVLLSHTKDIRPGEVEGLNQILFVTQVVDKAHQVPAAAF